VVEDAVDDPWFGDERDYAHLCTAAGTRAPINLHQIFKAWCSVDEH
jgi:hypothetical protein